MRGNITLRECENLLLFGNDKLELAFDKATGNWVGLKSDQVQMKSSNLPDCVLCLGGVAKSSVDTTKLNVHWARQVFEGTNTQGQDIVLTGWKVMQKQDAVCLCLEGEFGRFKFNRIYEISFDNILCRRFEAVYEGEETEFVRGAVYYTPAFEDMKNAEWPRHQIPGINLLGQKKAPVVAENGYDLVADSGTLPSSEDVMILHNDRCVMSVYNGLLAEEQSSFGLVQTDNGHAVRVQSRVAARLNKGDSLVFGEIYMNLTTGCWKDEAYRIGRVYESRGCRVNPNTRRSTLKDLVIYETEIGIVQFRPNKYHNVYNTLEELDKDLPRLRDIGYNCIQLMPSFPFPGYTVYDLHRPEMQHSLGADLKPFVEHAHQLGMKVVLDILLHGIIDKEISRWNQRTYSSRKYYYPVWADVCEYEVAPLRKEHPDWFIRQDDGDIFKVYTWSFDWANRGAQDWLIEALVKYVCELDVDGFRFDAPNWVGAANFAENLPYRADRAYVAGIVEGFQRARAAVDQHKPELVWITEPEFISMRNALDVAYTYSTLGMWPRVFRGELTGRQIQDFYAVRKRINPKGALYVNWMDNHDSWNDGTNETGEYSYEKFSPGFARSLLALALFQEGAYMAYAGNEKLDEEYYRRMLGLRRRERIFSEGECSFEAVHACSDALITMLWRSADETLLVVVNMTDKPVSACLCGLPEGEYVELVDGGCYVSGNNIQVGTNGCLLLKKVK